MKTIRVRELQSISAVGNNNNNNSLFTENFPSKTHKMLLRIRKISQ